MACCCLALFFSIVSMIDGSFADSISESCCLNLEVKNMNQKEIPLLWVNLQASIRLTFTSFFKKIQFKTFYVYTTSFLTSALAHVISKNVFSVNVHTVQKKFTNLCNSASFFSKAFCCISALLA